MDTPETRYAKFRVCLALALKASCWEGITSKIGPTRIFQRKAPDLPEDPTDRPNLQRLVRTYGNNPQFAHFVKALGQSRPGVVLCGGGGKGAYQIGSILALFDLGITDFSGIAGTSVGGLNAVLLHRLVTELTEGREKRRSNALQIWSSISRSKVFGGSWGMALKLVLFFFYVVLRAVPTIMNILQDDEHRFWSLIENACVKTASWRGAFSSNRAKNLIRLLATVLTSSLQLTLYAGSLLFIIIPFLDNARIKNFFGVFIQACFGSRPVAGLVLLLIGFALCIIGAVVWSRLNVFSFGLGLNTKPLAYSIKSALDGWSPSARQLPVYCTLASWEYRRISTMGAKRVSITGSWKKVYSPFYMPVDLADKEFAERMLLSTTALPFVFAGPDAKAGFVDGRSRRQHANSCLVTAQTKMRPDSLP